MKNVAVPVAAVVRGGVAAACLVLALGTASARDAVAVPAPFEVGSSSVGDYLSALVAGADRDTMAASTFFREALRSDPANAELIERAFVASLANGDIEEASDLARRLVARDPKNGLGHLVLGVEQFKGKHYVAARRQFSLGRAGEAQDVTASLLNAWTFAGQGDEKKALATVDAIKDSSFALFKNYHGALIADLAGDTAEATTRFKAAFAGDKSILRLVDAYARFFARHGDVAEAQRAYTAFDKTAPRHPIVVAAMGDLAAGRPLAPLIRNAEDGAAEVLYGLGAAGSRQGDELASMVYLRLSLYLEPQNAMATVTLADLYARLKQNEAAIDVYESVPAASPLKPNADVQTGVTLDTLGRSDEAMKHLSSIVSERPDDLDALTTLGNIERSQKHFDEAIKTYTKALALVGPDDKAAWPLLYFRGIGYERAKNWPSAEADFQHALKIVPDQPLVLNYLGYSWVDRGVHLDEAFKMLRRAVALRPEDGYIVDSLGWAHFKLGQYEDAVKELERAVELKPADSTVNDHLGDAYWRTGRKLEAHFQWNHARDLSPEPEDLPAIEKKVANGLPDDAKPLSAEADAPTTQTAIPPAPVTASQAAPAPVSANPTAAAPVVTPAPANMTPTVPVTPPAVAPAPEAAPVEVPAPAGAEAPAKP